MAYPNAMTEDPIRLGVIGFGGFGMFALQQFVQVPGVELAGMSGTHREAAKKAAERFGVPEIESVEEMVKRQDINLIYIATPPFLHHEQAMLALRAGKHVIVEKPFAMNMKQADEMIAAAREKDLLVIANLMQRYNPMFERVSRLIESKALGEVLHGYFENYASDEGLPLDHWFWDREKSGGIFIEHAVHFFDMFEGWLGEGRVTAAQAVTRPSNGVEDQVHCTITYGNAVLANMYHGFTQASRMDRQEIRLLFERGELTLGEWVPTRARIRGIADEKDMRTLCEIFPGARVDVETLYGGKERQVTARHKDFEAYQKFDLWFGDSAKKMNIYGDLLRAMIEDQIAWIRDRRHMRKITEENGRNSLAMAVEADRLTHRSP